MLPAGNWPRLRRSTARTRAVSSRAEGLRNIVICPQFKARNAITFFCSRRKHDDWHPRRLPDLAADFVAIHVRQHQVQNNQVWLGSVKRRQGQRPVLNYGYFITGLLQIHPHRAGYLAFVFNHQDSLQCLSAH